MTCAEAHCNASLKDPLSSSCAECISRTCRKQPRPAYLSERVEWTQTPDAEVGRKPLADIRDLTSEEEVGERMRSRGSTGSGEQRKSMAGRTLGEET